MTQPEHAEENHENRVQCPGQNKVLRVNKQDVCISRRRMCSGTIVSCTAAGPRDRAHRKLRHNWSHLPSLFILYASCG
jgi:hypothetical protein